MKAILAILTVIILSCCKKEFKQHHFYWAPAPSEACYYFTEDSVKVYVDKKYCGCH